ncbi:MAG: N-acetylmuramoyl-L-alanine amidase [Bacteroidales bacterium]
MRQSSKFRGLRVILTFAFLTASITMPHEAWAQSAPLLDDWVVVIDAGHGGKDPGTVGLKAREKDINLAVALRTGKYIKENLKDVKVIYTRDDDTFIGLAERADVANRNKADIFISIHSNAMNDKRFTGAETWVLGQSKDEANLQLAMKENSVITFEKDYQAKYEGYDPNSVESFIIFSLMQNTYLKQSTEFASMIQDQFRDRVGRKDRGVKQSGFVVLWRTTMPSVLVELGFLSNAEEEKYLISETGEDYLASAIYRAFRDYKHTIDNRSGLNANGTVHSETAESVKEDSTVRPATEVKKEEVAPPAPVPPLAVIKPDVVTDDIIFMVQITAMPKDKPMSQSQLSGIEKVTKIEESERIKYGAGSFSVYEDAVKYRRTLSLGFPDAFVIAVRNGKIIPLKDAIESKKTKQQ